MAIDIRNAGVFQGPDAPADDDLSTCVHCGLCLNYCPTYRVTNLETESPRGRLYLMTQWKRGQLPFTEELARHIDLCLGCRTCEAVCPSGVPYGRRVPADTVSARFPRESVTSAEATKTPGLGTVVDSVPPKREIGVTG